jgi:hypothetical protein
MVSGHSLPASSRSTRLLRGDQGRRFASQNAATSERSVGSIGFNSGDSGKAGPGGRGRGRSLAAACNVLQFGATCGLPLGENCPWKTPAAVPQVLHMSAGAGEDQIQNFFMEQVEPLFPMPMGNSLGPDD